MNLMALCCYSLRRWCKQHLSISTTVLKISLALRLWMFWTSVGLLKRFSDNCFKTADLTTLCHGFVFVLFVFHSQLQCPSKQPSCTVQPLFHYENHAPQVIPEGLKICLLFSTSKMHWEQCRDGTAIHWWIHTVNVFSIALLTQRLGGKNVSDMIYCVLTDSMLNLNSINNIFTVNIHTLSNISETNTQNAGLAVLSDSVVFYGCFLIAIVVTIQQNTPLSCSLFIFQAVTYLSHWMSYSCSLPVATTWLPMKQCDQFTLWKTQANGTVP